jgi:hypothetical protein
MPCDHDALDRITVRPGSFGEKEIGRNQYAGVGGVTDHDQAATLALQEWSQVTQYVLHVLEVPAHDIRELVAPKTVFRHEIHEP